VLQDWESLVSRAVAGAMRRCSGDAQVALVGGVALVVVVAVGVACAYLLAGLVEYTPDLKPSDST
jgi:hypothetical protein